MLPYTTDCSCSLSRMPGMMDWADSVAPVVQDDGAQSEQTLQVDSIVDLHALK